MNKLIIINTNNKIQMSQEQLINNFKELYGEINALVDEHALVKREYDNGNKCVEEMKRNGDEKAEELKSIMAEFKMKS